MASSVSPETIADRAAEWAVLAEYGEMTAEDRAELDAWLAADRRHRGALLRSRAGLYVAEDAVIEARSASAKVSALVSEDHDQDGHDQARYGDFVPGPVRRGFFLWGVRAVGGGAALAASVAALVAMGVPVFPPFRPTDAVAAEQIVPLKDGSIATLGKDARIKVVLSSDYRMIRLVSGAATFKVAHDNARPFVVQSGDIYAQATGTVYSVSRVDTTGGTVKVSEGSVLVWARGERDQAVLLHAGAELTLKPGPRLPEPKPAASAILHSPPSERAQIVFDHEPIRSAAVRFNRINSTKIVIDGATIGDTEIVGLFRADDPERFAQAAAALTGGEVERRRGRIVIKMQ